MVSHLCKASTSNSNGDGWFGRRSQSAEPRKVVIVAQGEGSWGALTFAGLHKDAGGGGDGYRVVGTVLASPIQFHRGANGAWWDAVIGASRVSGSTHPRLLEELLAAPPVKDDLAAVDPARAEANKRISTLPATQAAQTGYRMEAFINPGKANERLFKKEAETARKRRAAQHVLSGPEEALLDAAWTSDEGGAGGASTASKSGRDATAGAAGSTGGQPLVAAITQSCDSLPPFVHRLRRTAASAWWLQAANSAGLALLPEHDRAAARKRRLGALGAIKSTGLEGVLNPAVALAAVEAVTRAEAAAQAASSSSEGAFAATTAAADSIAAGRGEEGATTGVGGGDPLASASRGIASALAVGGAAAHEGYQRAVTFTPASSEDALVLRGLKMFPMALGLTPPPSAQTDPWYRHLASEAAIMPPNFSLVTVTRPDHALPAASPEAESIALIGYDRAVVSVPLQCPAAVAAEIRRVLSDAGAIQLSS